jgi:hypothetical protein
MLYDRKMLDTILDKAVYEVTPKNCFCPGRTIEGSPTTTFARLLAQACGGEL